LIVACNWLCVNTLTIEPTADGHAGERGILGQPIIRSQMKSPVAWQQGETQLEETSGPWYDARDRRK
jgi:hypothetical protein